MTDILHRSLPSPRSPSAPGGTAQCFLTVTLFDFPVGLSPLSSRHPHPARVNNDSALKQHSRYDSSFVTAPKALVGLKMIILSNRPGIHLSSYSRSSPYRTRCTTHALDTRELALRYSPTTLPTTSRMDGLLFPNVFNDCPTDYLRTDMNL